MAGSTGQMADAKLVVAGADNSTPEVDLITRVNGANQLAIQFGAGMTGPVQLRASINYKDNVRPGHPISGEFIDYKSVQVLAAGGNIIQLADVPMSHISMDLSGVTGAADISIAQWRGGK